MKVFARKMNSKNWEDVPVDHDLGIVIIHDGKRYTISVDNSGALIFRSVERTQVVILPHASNSFEIKSED